LLKRERRALLRGLGGAQAHIDPDWLERVLAGYGADIAGARSGGDEFAAGPPKLLPAQERSGAARPQRRFRLRGRGLDQGIVLLGRGVDDAQRDPEEDLAGERPEQKQRGDGSDHIGGPSRREATSMPGPAAHGQRKEPGPPP